MGFIVVEGDNATGKDTIADYLQNNYDFSVISRFTDITDLEKQAKRMTGTPRVNAFLKYNLICGNIAQSVSRGCIVRYWFSTLSAAFADNLMDLDSVLNKSEYCRKTMPAPDLVIKLKCNQRSRVNRIINRQTYMGILDDDVTNCRADKYWEISKKLFDISGYRTFEFETSSTTPEIIANCIARTVGHYSHGIRNN